MDRITNPTELSDFQLSEQTLDSVHALALGDEQKQREYIEAIIGAIKTLESLRGKSREEVDRVVFFSAKDPKYPDKRERKMLMGSFYGEVPFPIDQPRNTTNEFFVTENFELAYFLWFMQNRSSAEHARKWFAWRYEELVNVQRKSVRAWVEALALNEEAPEEKRQVAQETLLAMDLAHLAMLENFRELEISDNDKERGLFDLSDGADLVRVPRLTREDIIE